MTLPRRRLPVLALAALLAGACGSDPAPSPATEGSAGPSGDVATPSPTEQPFAAEAWPADGNACGLDGYAGLLGRIEAPGPRVVRFTLCRPDGAFAARIAHPALGVIDTTSVEAVAADPTAGRAVPGAGSFRVAAWTPGGNVRLERVGTSGTSATPEPSSGTPDPSSGTPRPGAPGEATAPPLPPPVIVLRWAASAADRAAMLRDASVDGIDDPAPDDAAAMGTLPELVVAPRPGLATAYLGFGAGKPFDATAVRRAFAVALDRDALAGSPFPAGSVAATHTAPCAVPAGCAGKPWYEANGPAASAALAAAGVGPKSRIVLHIPDGPVPGIPDPASLAAAIRDQLAASVGITVTLDALPAAALGARIADGSLTGLYLGGVESALADPSGFLGPLFGPGARGVAATRAKGVRAALRDAAAATSAAERRAAFAAANDAVRSTAPIVPLVHGGATVAYRSDVANLAVSPIWADPLGRLVPGDRGQLVVMQAAEPAGSWCGVGADPGALRLCALVTPGLLRFDGATLDPVPALAAACTPSEDAMTWTCRLRGGLAFSDGKAVDAGDVLASLRAQGDAGSPLRAARPGTAGAAWDALFGGPVPADAP